MGGGRLAWYWVPVLLYAGLIFYLSSLEHPEVYAPSLFQLLGDKLLHVIEYAVLGVLCYRSFRHAAGPSSARHALLLGLLTATAYGVSDELHQSFVPGREATIWDVLADGTGAWVGAGLWHLLGWRSPAPETPHGMTSAETRRPM